MAKECIIEEPSTYTQSLIFIVFIGRDLPFCARVCDAGINSVEVGKSA
jgi:hypothetical protein